jgi:short-subunit dehydrogenase
MIYAVVTGASQGIGRAITEKFLSEGMAVAVCARNKARLSAAVSEWRERYTDADIVWIGADMGTAKGAADFATLISGSFPQVDVLVNNAGAYRAGSMTDEAEGVLEEMMNVNLYGAYRLTRALLPIMRREQRGHIFNICSVAGLKAYKGIGSYSVSKYALMGFTDNLREELRDDNIKVTAICPGSTWSSSWEGSDVAPSRIMEAGDIAATIWAVSNLSAQAAAEIIVMRPVKGDF